MLGGPVNEYVKFLIRETENSHLHTYFCRPSADFSGKFLSMTVNVSLCPLNLFLESLDDFFTASVQRSAARELEFVTHELLSMEKSHHCPRKYVQRAVHLVYKLT